MSELIILYKFLTMFMLLANVMLSQYKKNTDFECVNKKIKIPINSDNIFLVNYLVFGLPS